VVKKEAVYINLFFVSLDAPALEESVDDDDEDDDEDFPPSSRTLICCIVFSLLARRKAARSSGATGRGFKGREVVLKRGLPFGRSGRRGGAERRSEGRIAERNMLIYLLLVERRRIDRYRE
jgi:hypothetical protein